MIFTKNIEEYNRNKQHKILTAFGDMVGDMLSKKESSIRGRKIKTSLVFFTHSYFAVPKLYILFYYENLEQMSASTNNLLLFIRYWFSTLDESLRKEYGGTIFKFS